MDWKNLYFGKVTKEEVFEAIKDEKWQKIRLSMKGKSLQEKYDILYQYVRESIIYAKNTKEIRMIQVRSTNYVTALSRGGLIKPKNYKII